MVDQVITLVAATARIFAVLEVKDIKPFQGRMLDYFHTECSDIVSAIETSGVLEGDVRDSIVEAAKAFKAKDVTSSEVEA